MTTDILTRCRHQGTTPIGFMAQTLPVCWLPAGHDGEHKTIYGATISEGNDE